MAESANYKAAKAVQEVELDALKKVLDLCKTFDEGLNGILATLDYPTNFISEARTTIANLRTAYSYQLTQIPSRIQFMSTDNTVQTVPAPTNT